MNLGQSLGYNGASIVLGRNWRAAILKRFNDRHLFKTKFFEHLEAPAHANLEWEIKALLA